MRFIIPMWMLVVTLTVTSVRARPESPFGLGVIVGEPTGVSAKLWVGERSAFDMAAAWSFFPDGYLHLHADYLFHIFPPVTHGTFMIYWGGGPVGQFWDGGGNVGARIPAGVGFRWEYVPIGIFVEIAPHFDFFPETDIGGNAATGVRFFFPHR